MCSAGYACGGIYAVVTQTKLSHCSSTCESASLHFSQTHHIARRTCDKGSIAGSGDADAAALSLSPVVGNEGEVWPFCETELESERNNLPGDAMPFCLPGCGVSPCIPYVSAPFPSSCFLVPFTTSFGPQIMLTFSRRVTPSPIQKERRRAWWALRHCIPALGICDPDRWDWF